MNMNNHQNNENSQERNPTPAKPSAAKPKPNVKLGQKLYAGMGWAR
jgi:hypothetical protein